MSDLVSVEGRITIETSGHMRTLISNALRSASDGVTVDLSAVSYMDISGLATLLEAMRLSKELHKTFALHGIQEQPRYLFKVTDLDHLFVIEKGAPG